MKNVVKSAIQERRCRPIGAANGYSFRVTLPNLILEMCNMDQRLVKPDKYVVNHLRATSSATTATESICTLARSWEMLVPHPFAFVTFQTTLPTFWPPRPNDWTPMEFAIDICEQENRALKILVISLSEIILNTTIG